MQETQTVNLLLIYLSRSNERKRFKVVSSWLGAGAAKRVTKAWLNESPSEILANQFGCFPKLCFCKHPLLFIAAVLYNQC